MLRKLMLPLVAVFALTGCLTGTGVDYNRANEDADEGEFVVEEHLGHEQPAEPAQEPDGGSN